MRNFHIFAFHRFLFGKAILLMIFFMLLNCTLQLNGVNTTYHYKPLNKEKFDGFPDITWSRHPDISAEGWSVGELRKAWYYYDRIGSAAAMLIHKGAVVLSWGYVKKKYRVHSIRKSFLFSLYGIHEQEGTIDLGQTIGDLGVTDRDGLSDMEKQAKVIDLLKCRSGVYHQAAFESPAMSKRRPPRHSHRPGEFYYYNNWDFNVLGTIFEQETQTRIFEEFYKRIAVPLQMEDFNISDGRYVYDSDISIHPAYAFVMSTRDLARFGLLYLNRGRWKNDQIIDAAWIRKSTAVYSFDRGKGVGFKWAKITQGDLSDYGVYQTSGYRGHRIMVIPKLQMVFVHRVNTFNLNNRVPQRQIEKLLMKVIGSHQKRGQGTN